jgi:hypothetical protein
MRATKYLVGAAAVAVFACAAPAAAQYYPGYGYPGYGYPNGGNVIGQVLGQVLGGGYGYGGYGANSQAVVNQCAGAVQARLNGGYSGYGYGAQAPVDLTWKCKTDYRGFVTDIDVDRAQSNYGYSNRYTPYDYSQYGYRRY